MALYDMTTMGTPGSKDPLVKVARTGFSALGIQERAHLQAALRDHIDLVDQDLWVVSEEFGDFEGAARRIDLLCVDRTCRLVVVELKRTTDGGHMELQALRYAAMVSTMTFDQIVRAASKYRLGRGFPDAGEDSTRDALLEWLDHDADEELVVPREVGIVLVSEDFSQEVTTTVLWLNEFHGFDIRCVRLSPYLLGERVLLDVQHVIPLPEASAYTIRVRAKETVARKSAGTSNADHTRFRVTTPSGASKPLNKRWAILELVQRLVDAGVALEDISDLLPNSKTLKVAGSFADADDLWEGIEVQFDKDSTNRKRWHLDDPIPVPGFTWVLNNNWGDKVPGSYFERLKELAALAPASAKITVSIADEIEESPASV